MQTMLFCNTPWQFYLAPSLLTSTRFSSRLSNAKSKSQGRLLAANKKTKSSVLHSLDIHVNESISMDLNEDVFQHFFIMDAKALRAL